MSKPYLVTVQRTNPLGETVAVEIELDSREDFDKQWAGKVTPAFRALDARLQQQNDRIIAVTQATLKLAPDVSDVVRRILLMSTGFAPPDVPRDEDMTHDIERKMAVVR